MAPGQMPHSSLQRTVTLPRAFGVPHATLSPCGLASAFTPSWSAQKLWITSSEVTWKVTGVSTGSMSSVLSIPPHWGYRYVQVHSWPITWTCSMSLLPGVQDVDCTPASFQMGDGPSPAPAPAGTMRSTVPHPNHHRTISVVPVIQVAWTLVLP